MFLVQMALNVLLFFKRSRAFFDFAECQTFVDQCKPINVSTVLKITKSFFSKSYSVLTSTIATNNNVHTELAFGSATTIIHKIFKTLIEYTLHDSVSIAVCSGVRFGLRYNRFRIDHTECWWETERSRRGSGEFIDAASGPDNCWMYFGDSVRRFRFTFTQCDRDTNERTCAARLWQGVCVFST